MGKNIYNAYNWWKISIQHTKNHCKPVTKKERKKKKKDNIYSQRKYWICEVNIEIN